MHIIYVLPKQNYFTQGRRGRVAHAIGVAGGLSACGVRVTVLSGPGTERSMQDGGVRCVEVDSAGSGPFSEWRWTTRAIETLQNEIASSAIDAVVVRYAVSNAYRYARVFRKASGYLTCFEVNSLAYHQYHGLPGILRRGFRFLERRILRSADMNNAVSSALASDLRIDKHGKPRIVVIPNAADPVKMQKVDRATKNENTGGPVKFIYMGVFQPYYELDLVVRSFLLVKSRGTEAELHLYGDGPQYDAIRKLAEEEENITLYGRYDLDDLLGSGVLDGHIVLLLPNRGSGMSEIGSPIKFYEYMSFGQSILASRVGQAAEVLEDEQTCLFYEPGDCESCALAMERLAMDDELRCKLAGNVLASFLSGHTWEARMNEFRHELEQLEVDSGND